MLETLVCFIRSQKKDNHDGHENKI